MFPGRGAGAGRREAVAPRGRLDVTGDVARIGLQPGREPRGQLSASGDVGTHHADGVRWTRRPCAARSAGDVVYVEPLDGKPGQFRLRQLPEISGAIVAMDPYTGRVLAMVGGFSFDQSKFNRATQALRPARLLVQALRLRRRPRQRLHALDGRPRRARSRSTRAPAWACGGRRTTTASSPGRARCAIGIERSKQPDDRAPRQDVGMPLVAEYAKRFGVYDDMLPVLVDVAGRRRDDGHAHDRRLFDVRQRRQAHPADADRPHPGPLGPDDLPPRRASARAAAPTGGTNQDEPRLIDRREQVLDPLTAYQMTSMMEGVVQRGTATSIKEVGKPLAGKTGTTNDAKDVWFVGFSPDLAVGVYMGYDKPKSLGTSATAGQYAAPIFRDFMKVALADKPATPFRVPPASS
jgi:penicillin-binding protein 1A